MCVHALDQVRISPRLHCNLHTVMPLHHYGPPQLPTVPCSMSLPPLPPPHSLEAREKSVVWEWLLLHVRHWCTNLWGCVFVIFLLTCRHFLVLRRSTNLLNLLLTNRGCRRVLPDVLVLLHPWTSRLHLFLFDHLFFTLIWLWHLRRTRHRNLLLSVLWLWSHGRRRHRNPIVTVLFRFSFWRGSDLLLLEWTVRGGVLHCLGSGVRSRRFGLVGRGMDAASLPTLPTLV